MQVRVKRVESRTGPEIVSKLQALDGSAEQIERDILLREIESSLTPEEARIFHLKALGFSSEEIAKVSRQLGELGRQGHEPPEAEISRADRSKGVENTGRIHRSFPASSPTSPHATSTDTEIADDERRSAP